MAQNKTAAREAAKREKEKSTVIYNKLADIAREAFALLTIEPGSYTSAKVGEAVAKYRAHWREHATAWHREDTADGIKAESLTAERWADTPARVEVDGFACQFPRAQVFDILHRFAVSAGVSSAARVTFTRTADEAAAIAEADERAAERARVLADIDRRQREERRREEKREAERKEAARRAARREEIKEKAAEILATASADLLAEYMTEDPALCLATACRDIDPSEAGEILAELTAAPADDHQDTDTAEPVSEPTADELAEARRARRRERDRARRAAKKAAKMVTDRETAAEPTDTPTDTREADSEAESEPTVAPAADIEADPLPLLSIDTADSQTADTDRAERRPLLLTIARHALRLAAAAALLLLLTIAPDRAADTLAAPADLTATPAAPSADSIETAAEVISEPTESESTARPAADRPDVEKRHHGRENKRESRAELLTIDTTTPDSLTAAAVVVDRDSLTAAEVISESESKGTTATCCPLLLAADELADLLALLTGTTTAAPADGHQDTPATTGTTTPAAPAAGSPAVMATPCPPAAPVAPVAPIIL